MRFARVQEAIWTAFFDACHKSNKAEKDGDNFAAEYHKKRGGRILRFVEYSLRHSTARL